MAFAACRDSKVDELQILMLRITGKLKALRRFKQSSTKIDL